jgi:antitoxin ParD1/3/4
MAKLLQTIFLHLAQGTQQAKAGEFIDDFSMDSLISELDNEDSYRQ